MPTDIEWTHFPGTIGETWNPINATRLDSGKRGWHCEKVSPGCANCYAETFNGRNLPACGTGLDYTVPNRALVQIGIHEDTLDKPLHWTKPRTIFVCSMTDLFADFVTDEMIDRVFAVMALCPQHRFIILTKRAKRMREYVSNNGNQDDESMRDRMDKAAESLGACHANMNDPDRWPLPNLILGVSVENQHYADERRPHLEAVAAMGWATFVSYEPALGPVDWSRWDFLKWLISGGESGPGARPSHQDRHRDARDFCVAFGIPYFFKQWGAWLPGTQYEQVHHDADPDDDSRFPCMDWDPDEQEFFSSPGQWMDEIDEAACFRVGKKLAGRLLDGRQWSEFPKMAVRP